MDPLLVYPGAALIAGACVLLLWVAVASPPSDDVASNLARGDVSSRDLALTASAKTRLLDPLFDTIADSSRRFSGEGAVREVRRKLELSGLLEKGWTVERLLAIRALSLALGVTAAVLALTTGVSSESSLVAGASLAVSYLLPMAWLNRQAEQRQALIERQLPDLIDQLSVSVEAGLGFEAALARSVEGRSGALADELRRVLQDLQLGVGRDEALSRVVERCDVPDLRQFVVAMRQSARHGLPLGNVLQVQSTELREKRRARIEERAGALPVKIVFPLVFCILPPLFVIILGPAAIDIVDTF